MPTARTTSASRASSSSTSTAAAAAFRRALEADPRLAIARLNLGIALFYGGDPERRRTRDRRRHGRICPSARSPTTCSASSPAAPGERRRRSPRSRASQRLDPADAGHRRSTSGSSTARSASITKRSRRSGAPLDAAPYNATAAYGLANALVLAGQADEGREAMAHFQRCSASSYAITYSQTYLEQGRYAEAIASTGAEPALVDTRDSRRHVSRMRRRCFPPRPRRPRTNARRAASRSSISTATAISISLDGGADGAARCSETTAAALPTSRAELLGAPRRHRRRRVLAGDYDNDGDADLAVLRRTGVAASPQRGGGVHRRHGGRRTSRRRRRRADGRLARRRSRRRPRPARGSTSMARPRRGCFRNNGNGTLHRRHDRGRPRRRRGRRRDRPDRLRQPPRHRLAAGSGRGAARCSSATCATARSATSPATSASRSMAARGDGGDRRRRTRTAIPTSSSPAPTAPARSP